VLGSGLLWMHGVWGRSASCGEILFLCYDLAGSNSARRAPVRFCGTRGQG
jgi:hypothetical protein